MLLIIGFKDSDQLARGVVDDFCAEVEGPEDFNWDSDIDGNVLDEALSQLDEADPDLRERVQDIVLLDIIK